MSFLYGECSREAERELNQHLRQCHQCAAQVKTWRAGMADLGAWRIPVRRARPQCATPILKWAAAAAAVLIVGFFAGRYASSSKSQIAELKASVAQLHDIVQKQSALTLSNSIAASTVAASNETIRLLANYSQSVEQRRASDQQTVNLALRAFGTRLNRMNDDLEAFALNTETGFQETHENITRVATLSLANKD